MRVLVATAGAACLVVLAGPAAAEEAPEGQRLFEQARFEDAIAWFAAVLEDPEASVREIATAHLYLATLRLVDGDEESAGERAAAAVALDPGIASPPGAPRRLDELLDEARAARPAGGLSIGVEAPACAVPAGSLSARAVVAGAPAGLVGSVLLRCTGGEASVASEAAEVAEVKIAVPPAAESSPVVCLASARTRAGVELRSARLEVPPCAAPAVPTPREAATESALAPPALDAPLPGARGTGELETARPGRRRVWLWVGVGAGAAAVVAAVVVGVVLGTAERDLTLGPIQVEGP